MGTRKPAARKPAFNATKIGHLLGGMIASATTAASAARETFKLHVKRQLAFSEWAPFIVAVKCEVIRHGLQREAAKLDGKRDKVSVQRREALEQMAEWDDDTITSHSGKRDGNPTLKALRDGPAESAMQALRRFYKETFGVKDIPRAKPKATTKPSETKVLNALHSTLESLVSKPDKYSDVISADIMVKLAKLATEAAELDAMILKRIDANKAADDAAKATKAQSN